MKSCAVAAVAAVLFSIPAVAHAHENRPLYVEIIEVEPLLFSVQWKVPPNVADGNEPDVALSPSCESVMPSAPGSAPTRIANRRMLRCANEPSGGTVEIRYPTYNPSVSTLVRLERHTGETHTLLGAPDDEALVIPEKETLTGVARQYLSLGILHILEGYDHLLFLVCLLLIAGTGRRIVITVTGFTIAHSVTLVLSALDIVRVPLPPVEATIALSIVFLAVEIARGNKDSLAYRYPIAVASTFGLLHGFGFAAVLGESGLPQTEIPAALLFFNLGVEVGQLAFIFAVIGAYQLAKRLIRALGARTWSLADLRAAEVPAAYVVGSLAAFWMFERIAAF